MDDATRRLIEEAAEAGARKALARVGLQDDDAIHDVRELRNLLDVWRLTRTTIGQTITRVVTTFVLGALAAGLVMKLWEPNK
jgi:hypothetical protein